MIVNSLGFSIEQFPTQNLISITLPQVAGEEATTYGASCKRVRTLSENELFAILSLVTHFYTAAKKQSHTTHSAN